MNNRRALLTWLAMVCLSVGAVAQPPDGPAGPGGPRGRADPDLADRR